MTLERDIHHVQHMVPINVAGLYDLIASGGSNILPPPTKIVCLAFRTCRAKSVYITFKQYNKTLVYLASLKVFSFIKTTFLNYHLESHLIKNHFNIFILSNKLYLLRSLESHHRFFVFD